MANTEEVKNKTKVNGGAPVQEPEAAASDGGDGWVDIQTDQPMYKPETCKSTPLIGYLLFTRQMPEGENGPWLAYAVKLTRPCLAVDGFDETAQPKSYPKGTEVLIAATAKIRDVVEGRGLIRAGVILEVKITPTEKVKIGGGRTLWRYDVQANEKTVKTRTAAHGLAAAPAARQLPGPGLSSAGMNDEIPF